MSAASHDIGASRYAIEKTFNNLWRLVLNLAIVLKTSNSARLVLLKSKEHYAKMMMMMGKTTCSDSFH